MTPRLASFLVVAVLAIGQALAAAQQPNAEALYQEARRLFDALDYERAVPALDQSIVALEAMPADASRNERLASAFEMRARSKFGLGDQDGARGDFVQLLTLTPGYALSGQVSPRVVTLFEEVAAQTVTNLTINLTPATATVFVDGAPLPGPGTIRVAVGEHVITAEQPGYRSARESVVALAGAQADVSLVLERVASVIRITTAPADVEVKVDGASLGRTAAGDAGAGGATTTSAPLIVNDVASGTHTIELSRECFTTVTQRVVVEQPDDYTVGPITLQPAVATLSITANAPNAQVFVDGRERGVAPLEIAGVCEGDHVVELRSPFGSDVHRVAVRAGSDVRIEAALKPAFAIVSASGASLPSQDVRVIVERAFAASKTVNLVAPPEADAQRALDANQLTTDWLAVDAAGRPAGASAQIAGPLRKDVSSKLADTFRSQGVASITMVDATRALLALLASGSTAPDVIEVALDSPASIAAAVARLDRAAPLAGTSLALEVVDVADVAGPVVVTGAPLDAGDVVSGADGKPVQDAAALAAIVAAKAPGDVMVLEAKDATGVAKRAEIPVAAAPKLIGLSEQGLLANRILLDLRARLAEATDPFETSVIRLNMAVALGRLGDWASAREELQRVTLPEGPGVGAGTVQYLLGVAAENLGSVAEAQAAFTSAAASASLLTEDGPPVRELAQSKLAELQR
jgi:tetratricopeptide (TPR) repeat protein